MSAERAQRDPLTQRRKGGAASESFSNKVGLEEHGEHDLRQGTSPEDKYLEGKGASACRALQAV